jgi:hypothetical protein
MGVSLIKKILRAMSQNCKKLFLFLDFEIINPQYSNQQLGILSKY